MAGAAVARLLLLAIPFASSLSTLPPHLRAGAVGKFFNQAVDLAAESRIPDTTAAQYLIVPLDHFSSSTSATWSLTFYVSSIYFKAGGPLFVNMPSEGPTYGCSTGSVARQMSGLEVCSQHRYFGNSVPNGNSSTAALRAYLSVEQNLADVAALIKHVRAQLPSVGATVTLGGSYAGASSAWMRHTYPDLVDAAVAQSPPITAFVGFPGYDVSNLVALSSPDSRCAHASATIAAALSRLVGSEPDQLMDLFGAPQYKTAPLGLTDFMYGLGDSTAAAVQYGQKSMLCDALEPLYPIDQQSDWQLATAFANYTLAAWGPSYFDDCFYNTTCMRTSVSGTTAQSARSWYWIKCSELGYLQVAPSSGLSTRPAQLTTDLLLEQCAYIFDAPADSLLTSASVAAFNAKFGGGTVGGTSKIFEVDYSDDPWKMATILTTVERQTWPLTLETRFMLLTCDGCAHCGSGVPSAKVSSINTQIVEALVGWGI